MLQFICNEVPEAGQIKHIDPAARGKALARMIVDAYLSEEHFGDQDASCPMIALPSDVARGNTAVSRPSPAGAGDDGRQFLEESAGPRRLRLSCGAKNAPAIAATAVGGMALASVRMHHGDLGDAVRESARQAIMAQTGWDRA